MHPPHVALPYHRGCPVIYDNDDHRDTYTDEYLIALASAGEIELWGMSTSYPGNNPEMMAEYRLFVEGRAEIVARARRSGMRRLPDPVAGPSTTLARPDSGRIEDTIPVDTPASRQIVAKARHCIPDLPLAVITGGPLTAVASAYLMDPSIADRVVVASLLGKPGSTGDYNGKLDPWAAYIVCTRLRYVQFCANNGAPRVPKSRLVELPDTELRRWMIEKEHPHNGLPAEKDADGPPALALLRPDFFRETRRVRVSHFDGRICHFEDDPHGNITVVTSVDGEGIGQEEFFRALTNPAAYALNLG